MVRAASGNRPIILLVDETMKLGEENVRIALAGIGRLLESFNDLHCVVSTLDLLFFNRVATQSGRAINWVKLASPNMSDCLHLLGLTNTDALNPVAQCILECNGHLRALGRLLGVWREVNMDNLIPLSHLMELLQDRFGSVQEMPAAAIIDALLGRYVTRLDAYGQVTVPDLIAGGAMLNYETTEKSFVARLSPFILRSWVQEHQSMMLAEYLQRVLDALDKLGQLAKDNEHQQGGAGFELFVVAWESLYRLLLSDKASQPNAGKCTLRDFFRGAVFNPSSLADVVIEVTAAPQAQTKKQFNTLTSTDPNPATHVLMYAHNNPGFEFTSRFKTSDAQKELQLCYHCRYSAVGSKNTLSLEDIQEAHARLPQGVPPSSSLSLYHN